MTGLPKFEGKQVETASVAITKAGDGLSDALDIEPEALVMGQKVYYLLEGTVDHIDHRPIAPDSKILERKHTVKTTAITRVPEEMATPVLTEASERIAEAREEANREAERAKGVEKLPEL